MGRWSNKWAVVTGASAGIGKALAEELAKGGANLILTARRQDRLTQLAQSLAAAHKIRTEIFAADLADPESPARIFALTQRKSIAVDVLINNAGFGAYGPFVSVDSDRLVGMVEVNCAAVVRLTRLFLPAMIQRRSGYVMIVASTASFQAVPYVSTYAATKAFDLSLAEGLAEEVRQFGVRVCGLCPGSTESEFREVANQGGHPANSQRRQESADKVARVGLEALAAGKNYVISGFRNYLGAQMQRLVPRRVVTRIAGNLFRPASEN